FHSEAGNHFDLAQFFDAANVEHEFRLVKLLPHRGQQVGAASHDLYAPGVAVELTQSLLHGGGSKQFETRQAQSSPPVSAAGTAELRRAGSSSCRAGPLPLNHRAPPCSRKRAGAVGSTPSVRSIFLAASFFARIAASTRSGVNGASRKRIPTAS